MRVSIIGSGTPTKSEADTARAVGRVLGERGHTLVCGGRGGIMAAACEGATETGGLTIGILPGEDPADTNQYVDVPIATGLGHARNALVVMNGDAVVAIAGSGGTLSEIGFASVYGKPLVGLSTHELPEIEAVDTPEQAVNYVEAAVK